MVLAVGCAVEQSLRWCFINVAVGTMSCWVWEGEPGASPSPQERRGRSRLSPVHHRLAFGIQGDQEPLCCRCWKPPGSCCCGLVSPVGRRDWMRILRPWFDRAIMRRFNGLQRFFISSPVVPPPPPPPPRCSVGGVISLSCRL